MDRISQIYGTVEPADKRFANWVRRGPTLGPTWGSVTGWRELKEKEKQNQCSRGDTVSDDLWVIHVTMSVTASVVLLGLWEIAGWFSTVLADASSMLLLRQSIGASFWQRNALIIYVCYEPFAVIWPCIVGLGCINVATVITLEELEVIRPRFDPCIYNPWVTAHLWENKEWNALTENFDYIWMFLQ